MAAWKNVSSLDEVLSNHLHKHTNRQYMQDNEMQNMVPSSILWSKVWKIQDLSWKIQNKLHG